MLACMFLACPLVNPAGYPFLAFPVAGCVTETDRQGNNRGVPPLSPRRDESLRRSHNMYLYRESCFTESLVMR